MLMAMDRLEKKLFFVCLAVSAAIHFAAVGLSSFVINGNEGPDFSGLEKSYVRAVERATELDMESVALMEETFAVTKGDKWSKNAFIKTVDELSSAFGLQVDDLDLGRALDPDRAKENRLDLHVWLQWDEDRNVSDILKLAYVVGEGTLKSDFGSHRLWINLDSDEGSGKVAFETTDLRSYKAAKMTASDLLFRGEWVSR